MAKIRITDLRLRTIIGIFEWERTEKQDIIVNIVIDFDATKAALNDDLNDTVDYDTMTKRIIESVESSSFFLLEKLTDVILNIIMESTLVDEVLVRVDKPNALRFADSVSVELSKKRL